MKDAEMTENAANDPAPYPRTVFIRRHALVTRLTHWLNLLFGKHVGFV